MSDPSAPDPLENGLRRHVQLVERIAALASNREDVIEISRMVDDLVAAVLVETLERCRTEEARAEEARKIRAVYERRWRGEGGPPGPTV